MTVIKLDTQEKFENMLKESGNNLVVIDFYAEWCGPCKKISPAIEQMAEENKDVIFVKVDVDENAEIAEEQKISAMPTFQLYKNGKKVGEVVGASEEKLKEEIRKNK